MNITFMKFFIILNVLFLLISIILYWWRNEKYIMYLRGIRKTYYFAGLSVVLIGYGWGRINNTDWKLIGTMLGCIVFVDLAIFLTPNITKLFNAEFQNEQLLEESLRKMKKTVDHVTLKTIQFNSVIEYSDYHFREKEDPKNNEEYKKDLEEYLSMYNDVFQYDMKVHRIDSSTVEIRDQHMQTILQSFQMWSNIEIPGKQYEENVNTLLQEKILVVEIDEYIIAYSEGVHNSFLIAIKSNGSPVNGVDAYYIISLCRTFEWWMT
ncbi:type II toxin-antitoxin system SpoIISA family toxin [Bacillus sp. RG28]|uniref:Type II toxin-antitoxin system SpoIISA family toxin n=1 Tax=Gottfriedia endophytica TaxID=2820819 RepID=A0A940SID5_9BACI|nr:type II toxin-antitoxin system SpoIISA family toxin [Gottfriedia endophytica]MBP0723679.1 type II toxin-antitoxin system SpoIISA family toxin [Gottfriedia endophytica]